MALSPGWRLDRFRHGPEARNPRGEVGQRPFGCDLDGLAVDLRLARQHRAERLSGAHPGSRRPAQPVEQRRVEDHPSAPQPDQRPFRRREGGDLVGVEQRAVERELPAEFQQRREPEPGFGQLLRGRRDGCPQFQAVVEHAGRPHHLDAGARQGLGRRAEQAGERVVVQVDRRGAGLLEHLRERRPYRCPAAQREQQVRLRLRSEPGEHGLRLAPQRGSVHDQTRVAGAAQLQHQPEPRRRRFVAGLWGRIDVG